MSENLDLVRSIYANWKRGDFTSVEWAHLEIEFVFADGPEPSSWKGLGWIAEGWRDFLGRWEEFLNYFDCERAFADLGLKE
jgi:hypothetical protein